MESGIKSYLRKTDILCVCIRLQGQFIPLKKILPKRLWNRLRKKSSFSNPLDGILILALQKNIGENGWKRKKYKSGKIVATTRRWYDRGIPREIRRLPKPILEELWKHSSFYYAQNSILTYSHERGATFIKKPPVFRGASSLFGLVALHGFVDGAVNEAV